MRYVMACVAVMALAAACGDDDDFVECATSSDCLQGGISGVCLPSPSSSKKWCAFEDSSCPGSEQRWGILSGDGLAGTCVASPDGGMPDAATPDAPAPDGPMPDAPQADATPIDAMLPDGPPLPDATPGTTVEQVSAGGDHTCALLSTGVVRCWGKNANGQLGYGNTTTIGDTEAPITAGDVNVGGSVAQIAAGGTHTCAVLAGGAVRCWGNGSSGRLGYGNTNTIGDTESPASAGDVNVGGSVEQVAVAGSAGSHTCALLSTGAVRCWGYSFDGRLGYGNTDTIGDDEAPAMAGDVLVGGTVTQVVTGPTHTCALIAGGTVRCWGNGSMGRLGYGNTNNIGDNETPATAGDVNVGGTVTQLAAGTEHTCALLSTGAVRCWGNGNAGRLGYGNTNNIGDNESPAAAGDVPLGGTALAITAGGGSTCALMSTFDVRCWGAGGTGSLGYGNTNHIGDNETPATAGDVNIGGLADQVAAGGLHTCAVMASGQVRCWGSGLDGRLGYAATNSIGDDEDPATAGDITVY